MATRTAAIIGAPCWIDLLTSDPEASRTFYTRLLGWTADEPDPQFGGYFSYRRDGVLLAGCMGRQPGMEAPDGWSVYLAVEDARHTVEVATAHGGQVIVPPMDVADLGVMAVLMDPAGAAIGIWQPGAHQGFGTVYEPGAPAWFELHTNAYEASLDFYRQVFGWATQTMSDAAEFRYTLLVHGDEQLAGVMADSSVSAGGQPPHWLVYLGVPDTDAALAAVAELGGAVTRPAEDTPYGRLASVTDPTGARFNLVGRNVETAGAPAGETAGTTS